MRYFSIYKVLGPYKHSINVSYYDFIQFLKRNNKFVRARLHGKVLGKHTGYTMPGASIPPRGKKVEANAPSPADGPV